MKKTQVNNQDEAIGTDLDDMDFGSPSASGSRNSDSEVSHIVEVSNDEVFIYLKLSVILMCMICFSLQIYCCPRLF